MNIDDLTLGQFKELARLLDLTGKAGPVSDKIGKYVIVRCRDAGVHAGILVSSSGRSCSLKQSRRLWYWKPANGAAFLSGVATHGLDPSSKVGEPVAIDLTENCEIIECTNVARASISGAKNHVP